MADKKFTNGELCGTFLGRVVGDPKISSFTGKNDNAYDLVSVRAVCSPYNGDRDPAPIWCTLKFNGNSNKMSKNLKKGMEVFVKGSIRPRIWMTAKNEPRLEIDINVSRDWNSLVITKWGENNNTESTADSPPQAQAADNDSGVQFSEDDIPF